MQRAQNSVLTGVGIGIAIGAIVATVLWYIFTPQVAPLTGGDDDEPPVVFEPKGGVVGADEFMVWYRCDEKDDQGVYDCTKKKTEIEAKYNLFVGTERHKLPPAFIGGLGGGKIEAFVRRDEGAKLEAIEHVCIQGKFKGKDVEVELDFTAKEEKKNANHISWQIHWGAARLAVGRGGRLNSGNSRIPTLFTEFPDGSLNAGKCSSDPSPVYSLKFSVRQ